MSERPSLRPKSELSRLGISFESSKRASPSRDRANLIFFRREIFSYLDKVDSTCDKALIDAKSSSHGDRDNLELEFALEPDVIEDVPK